MKSTFQITIAEPCEKNWDEMKQLDGQNFCDACSKCVVDFSHYTNSAIINLLKNNKNEICGRISQAQLNQINHQLTWAPKNSYWLRYLGVLAIGVGFFNPSAAAAPNKNPIEINRSIFGLSPSVAKPLPIKTISGHVFDENKKPIAGVRIIIRNTRLFAITDKTGRYSITLTDGFDRDNRILEVKNLRYSGNLTLNFNQQKQADLFLSKSEPMIMGMMIMVNSNKNCL